MPTSLRHRARIIALQTLYEVEFAANKENDILKRNLENQCLPEEAARFADSLVSGVISNRQLLDETISSYARAFPVDQLAVMDRNILRLALFEITIKKEVPPKVAVNEAVELAKEFGADTAPKFVNGVLGAVISKIKNTAQQTD